MISFDVFYFKLIVVIFQEGSLEASAERFLVKYSARIMMIS